MSDRIKKLKIKKQDGTFSDYIPIGANAENIDFDNGYNLDQIVGNINPDEDGTLEFQLNKTIKYYNTVADMKSDIKLQEGDLVETKGYYSLGDTKRARYRIRQKGSAVIDNGKYHLLNNGLLAELVVTGQHIEIAWFGAKGDGSTDDYDAIYNCLVSGYKEIHFDRLTYAIRQSIEIQSINGLTIYGNQGIIKNLESNPETGQGHGTLIFDNCKYLVIKDLMVNANRTWMNDTFNYTSRPLNTESNYDVFIDNLYQQLNSFSFKNCQYVYLNNCIANYCRIGYLFSNTKYVNVANCKTMYTWADGIAFSTGCKYCQVSNHYCEMVNDDQYSAWGYSDNTGAEYIFFDNCYSHNCWGALACFEGASHCWINNSISDNCNYTPLKGGCMSNSTAAFGTDHHYINCEIKMSNRVQPLAQHGNNLVMAIATNDKNPSVYYENVTIDGTNMSSSLQLYWDHFNECIIDNCTFINLKISATLSSGLLAIRNSNISISDNNRFIINGIENVILDNNYITSSTYNGDGLVAIGQDGNAVNKIIDKNNTILQANETVSHLICYAYINQLITNDPYIQIVYWERITKIIPQSCVFPISAANKNKVIAGSIIYNTTNNTIEQT